MENNTNTTKEDDNKRTLKHGVVGGAAGLLLGVPILGVAAGIAYANKDKIKTAVKKVDTFLKK